MKITLDLEGDEYFDLQTALEARILTLTGIIARSRKSQRAPLEARLNLTKAVKAKLAQAVVDAIHKP
jgi:hypothetical protein